MKISNHQFVIEEGFTLKSGEFLPSFYLNYTTIGTLNADKSNVIWVFHALTANSNPTEWWSGLVGENKILDTKKHFIICVNMPNSCYGSIQPLSVNPNTNEPYYSDFPLITIYDMVKAYQHLRDSLGISSVKLGIGGSMGGQQLVEWACQEPSYFEKITLIATNAVHSPWGIGLNTTQRMAIEADGTWGERNQDAGKKGLKAARSMAIVSYRNYDTYDQTQSNDQTYKLEANSFPADSYQRYQGEKLANRFNAYAYYRLTQAMDAHDVGKNRGGVQQALSKIESKALCIGINSDLLFPPREQKQLAKHIPNSTYKHIDSLYGHDGFLLENDQLTEFFGEFLEEKNNNIRLLKTS